MVEAFAWTSDRRRSPRVAVLAHIEGDVMTLDEQVRVKQLSRLGMTVETTAPLSPRVQHDFRISLEHSAITVRGQVVHSRVVIQGDAAIYVAGVAFVDPSPEVVAGIDRMVEESLSRTEEAG